MTSPSVSLTVCLSLTTTRAFLRWILSWLGRSTWIGLVSRCSLRLLAESGITTFTSPQTQMFLRSFPQLHAVTQRSNYRGQFGQTRSGDFSKDMRSTISDAANRVAGRIDLLAPKDVARAWRERLMLRQDDQRAAWVGRGMDVPV